MDCMDLFKKAAAAMQTDPRYLALDAARRENDADAELQNLIGEFNLARLDLNNESTKTESDAARVAGSGTGAGGENGDGEGGWRNYMDLARSVAADMATTGEIIVMQSGEPIPDGTRLQDISGPIRLARGPKFRI